MAARRTSVRGRRASSRPRRIYTRRLIPVLRTIDIDMVARAMLNGADVDARLVNAISAIEADLTMDGASQLTLTVEDPSREILRSELLEDRIDLALAGAGRWRMNRPRDVGGLSITGSTTRLRLWDLGPGALQERFDPLAKRASQMNLRAFVALLAREVRDEIALDVVVPDPGEVPHLEQESRRDRVGAGSGSATSGWSPRAAAQVRIRHQRPTVEQLRVMDAVFTEALRHDPPALALLTLAAAITDECDYYNRQGEGADKVSWGVIQNIPGTSVGVDGVMTQAQAMNIAYSVRSALLPPGPTSQGGLIRAAREHPSWHPGQLADLCINGVGVGDPLYVQKVDSYATEARRNIELWTGRSLDAFAGGGGANGRTEETSYRPAEWRRGTDQGREGSWKTLKRYADQLGRRRFVAGPTTRHPRLILARDQQLILATPHMSIALDDDLIVEKPNIDLEGRELLEQIEMKVLASAWSAPPGAVVDMNDAGPADGPWLTLGVRLRSGDPLADVVLTQPMTRRQPDPARSRSASRRSSGDLVPGSGATHPPFAGRFSVSSPFGWRPGPPARNHMGIDIPMPVGTLFFAAFDGTITMATTTGFGRAGGMIHLRADADVPGTSLRAGDQIGYGHASLASVSAGKRVRAGERIGASGYPTSPHCHFVLLRRDGGGNGTDGNADPAGVCRQLGGI